MAIAFNRLFAICFVFELISGVASAQLPFAAPIAPATQGNVDIEKSRIFTFVKGTGMGHDHGMEARLTSGQFDIGATGNAGQLVIDINSFDADSPSARQALGMKGKTPKWMRKQVRKEMLGKKVLAASSFPTAKLAIDSCMLGKPAKAGAPATFQLKGRLTFHGVTNAVAFPVAVRPQGGKLLLTGRYTFKQSDYGIQPLSKGFGSVGVADEVTVLGQIWVNSEPGPMASAPNGPLVR